MSLKVIQLSSEILPYHGIPKFPLVATTSLSCTVSKILLLTTYATCDLEMSFSFELSIIIVAFSKSRVNVGYDVVNARHISRGMRPTIVSKTIGDFPCHSRAIRQATIYLSFIVTMLPSLVPLPRYYQAFPKNFCCCMVSDIVSRIKSVIPLPH